MKKVIGVAVAASLVAGMAFADVAVSLNARMRADMYNKSEKENGAKVTTVMDLDKYGAYSDTLGFKASTDFAGVALELTVSGSNAGASTVDGSKITENVAVDNYYGWMNWGAFKVTTGVYDSRFTNRYNVSATESGLTDSDTAKFGISNLTHGFGKSYGYDFNNVSQLAGGNKISMLADYTIADLPGKLLLKAGLLESTYKADTTDSTDKKYQESGYMFEAAYAQDKFSVEAALKMPTEDQLGFGIYVEPKVIPNANTVLGFTYIKDDTEDVKGTAYAVDARFVYALSSAAKAVVQGKYTSIKPDGEDAETGFEAVAEVSYIVNDLLTLALDGGVYYTDLDDNDKEDIGENYIKVRPAAKIIAGKNAAITVGFEYQTALNGDEDAAPTALKSQIKLPVIFRVKM